MPPEKEPQDSLQVRGGERPRRAVLDVRGYSVNEENLRYYRTRQFMTQQELAQKSGLSLGQVNRIEQGNNSPHFATIESLARALDVPPEELIRKGEQVAEVEPEPRSTRYLVQAVPTEDGSTGIEAYTEDLQHLLNMGEDRGRRLVHIGEARRFDATIVVWDTAPSTD